MRQRRLLESLNQMLDEAERGSFTPEQYDETLLSAIECRMKDFLSAQLTKQERLEADRDAVRTLISDLSHQTKTPLTSLKLYTELLSERAGTKEEQDLSDALLAQTKKLSFLIDSLVSLSRLETGILTLHPVESGLLSFLTDTLASFAERAEAKRISLTLREPADTLTACFDPKWTAEALSNILDNAIKYAPAKASVTVSVEAYECFVRINVTNTGTEIPEPLRARIFERFYRADTVAQEDGVGIGLFLAREILTREGGYIKVESAGQQTTFSLFLPKSRF